MQHVHFGAGLFGLGFAAWIFGRAQVPVHLYNREAAPLNKSSRSGRVDDGKKEPSVSSYERNDLLRKKLGYFVLYPSADETNGDIHYQPLASFATYDPVNLDEIQFPDEILTDDIAVTFSLRQQEAYDGAFELFKVLLLERSKQKAANGRVYLMAFEDGIETKWVWGKLKGECEAYPELMRIAESEIITAEVSVDRICFSMSATGSGKKRFLGIIAEKHARLVIEDKPSIEPLKKTFEPIPEYVSFSQSLEYERLKKLLVVNGSHALTAIHVLSHKLKYLDDYLKGERIFDSSTGALVEMPSVEYRQNFIFDLIVEIIEGFTMTIEYKRHRPSGGEDLTDPQLQDKLAKSILERFSSSRDSVFRVIRNFIVPEPDEEILNRNKDFFKSLRSKIERPVGAYMDKHHREPHRVSRVLLELLVLIAEADYINRVHHYSKAVH